MRIGIDFGTCFSSATLMKDGEVIPIKATDGLSYSWPSSAYLLPTGEMLVGRAAENQRVRDITRYQHEFKRKLGDKEPLWLGDRSLFAHELVAHMLRKLKEEADHLVQEPLTAAVVTIPATYTSFKFGLMEQAAHTAGFQTVELLEEPVAAAVAYAQQKQSDIQEGEIVMVYDLGGGTFDIALLRKRGSDYEFLAPPAGLERCGGTDFDQAIYADLCKRRPQLQAVLDPQRQDAEALLARSVVLEQCIKLKHQLSETQEWDVPLIVPGLASIEYYSLSRQAFEQMIVPDIEKTLECCWGVLKSAGVQVQQVDRILLVGGSCRIPYICEQLKQAFGRPVSRARDLELMVCQGAALFATEEEERTRRMEEAKQRQAAQEQARRAEEERVRKAKEEAERTRRMEEERQGRVTQEPARQAEEERVRRMMSVKNYSAPPPMQIDKNRKYHAVLKTNKGDIHLELKPAEAPLAVNNFVFLAKEGFYNGVKFHRVWPGVVIQAGDPTGTGRGGPGYRFNDELLRRPYKAGTLAMANAGPNTNGSQFFICIKDQPKMLPSYTIFGETTSGMEVVRKICQGDVIETVTIE